MRENKKQLHILCASFGFECMLTGYKWFECELTYHHIKKKADGGLTDILNGAVVSSKVQNLLHDDLERNNPELYNLINKCLILYKRALLEGKTELINQYRNEIMPKVKYMVINKSESKFDNPFDNPSYKTKYYNNQKRLRPFIRY